MTPLALALVLTAAVLHAGWNLLAKQSRDTVAFLWWGVAVGAAGYGVYLLLSSSISFSPDVLPFFLVSDLAELLYFITLVRGYREGDLSLVYPISRGSAPLFAALWSALALGERLPPVGYGGVALMVAGIYVASLAPGKPSILSLRNRAALWALASGVFVSIYSTSDKLIVSRMSPLAYNFWVYAGNAVTWLPVVWTARRWKGNLAEFRANWPRILVGSAMTVGAYVAVLVALSFTPASYVVAGRGTSVIVGALLGSLVLGEGFGRVRILGACIMFAGLAIIALA